MILKVIIIVVIVFFIIEQLYSWIEKISCTAKSKTYCRTSENETLFYRQNQQELKETVKAANQLSDSYITPIIQKIESVVSNNQAKGAIEISVNQEGITLYVFVYDQYIKTKKLFFSFAEMSYSPLKANECAPVAGAIQKRLGNQYEWSIVYAGSVKVDVKLDIYKSKQIYSNTIKHLNPDQLKPTIPSNLIKPH